MANVNNARISNVLITMSTTKGGTAVLTVFFCQNTWIENMYAEAEGSEFPYCMASRNSTNLMMVKSRMRCKVGLTSTLWGVPASGLRMNSTIETLMSELDWKRITTTATTVAIAPARNQMSKKGATVQSSDEVGTVLETVVGITSSLAGNSGGTSATYAFQQTLYLHIINRRTMYLPLPWYLHPTGMSLGPCTATSSHLGAVVGNTCIIVACFVLQYFVLGKLWYKGDFIKAKFPKYGTRVEGHFRGVIWSCCIIVVAYSGIGDGSGPDCDGNSTLVVFLRVAMCVALCASLLSHCAFRRYVMRRVWDNMYNESSGEWFRDIVVQQFGFMFKSFRPRCTWYGHILLSHEFFVAYLGAIAFVETDDDNALTTLQVIVCSSLLCMETMNVCVIVLFKPYAQLTSLITEAMLGGLQMLAFAMVLMGRNDVASIVEFVYSVSSVLFALTINGFKWLMDRKKFRE